MQKISFKFRLIIIVSISLIICSSVSIVGFLYFNKQELYRGIIEKSRAIHLRLDAAVAYVALQDGLNPVIERMKKKYNSPNDISKEDKEVVLKQVPIVAAMKIGAMNSEKDNYEFRIFSNDPRNEGNRATAEELKIFKKFEDNIDLKEQVVNTGNSISVYKAVRLTNDKGCFKCHGDPATSPWGNGRDILGYQMENWKEGKLHGVFEVKTDLIKLAAAENKNETISPALILVFGIILSGVIGIIVAVLMIKKPISDLNKLANDLEHAGNKVGSEATQIASAAEELSQASTEQASSLQETSSSVEEINTMVNNNNENAKQANQISEASLKSTQKGKEVVEKMIEAIGDINTSNQGIANQIDETNKEIENIINIINEIEQKTKVINDIVFQTKLLSFNASVEAARAGESGKGFAVVADEVGKLAAMSGKSAEEIASMLVASTRSVENIVKNSKDKIGKLVLESKTKVDNGSRVASECEQTFSEILINISKVAGMINEISNASQEQSQGINEINKAMSQLDEVTHQNTMSASSSAESASSLSAQSAQLNDLVKSLIETVNGKKG